MYVVWSSATLVLIEHVILLGSRGVGASEALSLHIWIFLEHLAQLSAILRRDELSNMCMR